MDLLKHLISSNLPPHLSLSFCLSHPFSLSEFVCKTAYHLPISLSLSHCIYLSINLSITFLFHNCLQKSLLSLHLFLSLSVSVSVSLSVCLSVCLSLYLSINLSYDFSLLQFVCKKVYQPPSLSFPLSLSLSFSICLSACLSLSVFIYLSIYLIPFLFHNLYIKQLIIPHTCLSPLSFSLSI